MTADRNGFLSAILADPADDAPRAAYADWLRETGDPHDEAHGRFVAAGLVLHHTPAPEDGNEGVYYDAIAAQGEAAPAVIGPQAAALLGWPAHVEGESPRWAWDNDAAAPGRVVARLLPAGSRADRRGRSRTHSNRAEELVYERGCVAGARLSLRAWGERGRGLLERCPLARAEVLDVPGLSLRFEREPGAGAFVWRVRGRLVAPPSHRAALERRLAELPDWLDWRPFGAPQYALEALHPRAGQPGWTRHQVCAGHRGVAWGLVERLARAAGPAWPGPPADALYAALFDSAPAGG